MKSIEKLRKVAEEQSSPVTYKMVRAYTGKSTFSASNAEVGEALGLAVDEIEQEVEERYIERPTDKNGIPIHVGDRLKFDNGNDDVLHLTVKYMHLYNSGWRCITSSREEVLFGNTDLYGDRFDRCIHERPDSWEQIIEDVRRRTSDYYCNQIPCDFGKMSEEMVARCKALAKEKAC